MKREKESEVFLESLSRYFYFRERKAFCPFGAGIVSKSQYYHGVSVDKSTILCLVLCLAFHCKCQISLLLPVSLCTGDFIYNKDVIYENLKALTTP